MVTNKYILFRQDEFQACTLSVQRSKKVFTIYFNTWYCVGFKSDTFKPCLLLMNEGLLDRFVFLKIHEPSPN